MTRPSLAINFLIGLLFGSGSTYAQLQGSRVRSRRVEREFNLEEVHAQCGRGNPEDLKNRPLLILKYARTGSTWLAWTGNTLRLDSGKPMVWTHEAQGCGKLSSEDLTTWLEEYFSRETDGRAVTRNNLHKNNHGPHGLSSKCLATAGEDPDKLGVLVATLNPHESHDETPPLSDEQWERIFTAAPDLAIGVLVRTNAVKRAVSAIAADYQRKVCGHMKLTGKEDCISKLPNQIELEERDFMGKIWESEMKRSVVTDIAGDLATKYGDGRIFCLSYEAMEMNLVQEMKDLGEFIGSPISEASLDKLRESAVTYKRGSDDLTEYLANYDEVHGWLSDNQCLLDQLEQDEPRNHPLCNLYDGECKEGYNSCVRNAEKTDE